MCVCVCVCVRKINQKEKLHCTFIFIYRAASDF